MRTVALGGGGGGGEVENKQKPPEKCAKKKQKKKFKDVETKKKPRIMMSLQLV